VRILAVRGRNLASLAGDFEVRLDAPPLDSAGLFAITGKTGAGKSTILDALCLALYDRIPRLLEGSGVEVGREDDEPGMRLRNNDVRSILRRGAGEGYAEVEFLGMDGRRNRARWSVRRARNRAGGRFQAQELALWDLDSGESLGGTKTEVLALIEERLGLTFDQFRRSVLLAQGDFAAFLRASPKERAELLERITGTEIYSRLSRAAHDRAKQEAEQLRIVEQRLGDHKPLDDEARQALEAGLAEAQRGLAEKRNHQARLQQAQVWYQTRDRLVEEHEQASKLLRDAEAAQAEAAPRRASWERVRGLQPLRLPLTTLDKAIEDETETRQSLDASSREEQQAKSDAQLADTAVAEAMKKLAAVEQARKDAGPALIEARGLDTRIADVERNLGRMRQEHGGAAMALRDAETARTQLKGQLEDLARSAEAASTWLEAHQWIRPVATQWEGWERELGRYARTREEQDRAGAELKGAEGLGAELTARRVGEVERIRGVEAESDQTLAHTRSLEEQAAAFDLDKLAAEREALSRRQSQLDERRRLIEQAVEVQKRLVKQRDALTEAQNRLQKHEERLQVLGGELEPLQSALAEAEAAHARMLLASAENVETLREQLVDGQPCPVCGAEDHPWAHRGADVLRGLVQEQRQRVDALRGQVQELTREQSARQAEAAQARKRAEELAAEMETEEGRLQIALAAWAELPSDGLRPEEPFELGLSERITSELEKIASDLDRIRNDENTSRALAGEIRKARETIERLRAQLDQGREGVKNLDDDIVKSQQVMERASTEIGRTGETIEQVLELLGTPFAGWEGWEERLRSDPEAFAEECRKGVEEWRGKEAERDEASTRRQALEPRLAEAATRCEAAAADLARRAKEVGEHETTLAELRRQRGAVLNGRPADQVEQSLERDITEARDALCHAQSRQGDAQARLKALEGRITIQKQTLERFEAATIEAKTEMDALLREHDLDLPALRKALEHDGRGARPPASGARSGGGPRMAARRGRRVPCWIGP